MLSDYFIARYANKFLADNSNIDDLSDSAFDRAFRNCVMHTKIKRDYARVRATIVTIWKTTLKQAEK